MNCPLKTGKGAEVFIAYTAGTLPVATEQALQQHLEVCPDCQRAAAAQHAVWSALDAWRPAAVSSNFDEKLFARIAAEVNSRVENIGARRLQTVLEKLLEDVSFEAEQRQGETLLVDAAYVEAQLAEIARDTDLSKYVL